MTARRLSPLRAFFDAVRWSLALIALGGAFIDARDDAAARECRPPDAVNWRAASR